MWMSYMSILSIYVIDILHNQAQNKKMAWCYPHSRQVEKYKERWISQISCLNELVSLFEQNKLPNLFIFMLPLGSSISLSSLAYWSSWFNFHNCVYLSISSPVMRMITIYYYVRERDVREGILFFKMDTDRWSNTWSQPHSVPRPTE